MFGSGILDTIIGLIFVFLLVSLLVTIMNEMIAAAFQSRAKWLRFGIERLLGSDWMEQLYAHPLVEGSAQNGATTPDWRDGPSYIPSRSFANILMSIIHDSSGGIADCQRALRAALESASASAASVEALKAQLAAAADKLRQQGRLQASVAGDLTRRLGSVAGADPHDWLGELTARIASLRKEGGAALDGLLPALDKIVEAGIAGGADIATLRQRFADTVATLLQGPATAELKDELTAMGKRLRGPYSVADAYADLHWFIDGLSARYVRQMLEALPDQHERMRTLLLTLFDDANNDIEKFKENIEVWFNNGMDRVNGWYKRRSQWVSLGLAATLAVALNVDAIAIFRHLQSDPQARQALVAQAEMFVKSYPGGWQGGAERPAAAGGTLSVHKPGPSRTIALTTDNPRVTVQPASLKLDANASQVPFTLVLPVSHDAGTVTVKSVDGSTDEVALSYPAGLPEQLVKVQHALRGLTIPIGWATAGTPSSASNGAEPGAAYAVEHAFGWLLTALAATLGAPFWFDMLNRVVSIRASGKPPEEEPKPPKSVSVPVEPGQSQQEAERMRHNDLRR